VEIVDEGRYRPASETPFNRPVFEIGVKLPNGEFKVWTMNRTTQRALIDAYGSETKQWVGKKVIINVVSQNVRGVMKDVLYGQPAEVKPPEVKPRKVEHPCPVCRQTFPTVTKLGKHMVDVHVKAKG